MPPRMEAAPQLKMTTSRKSRTVAFRCLMVSFQIIINMFFVHCHIAT